MARETETYSTSYLKKFLTPKNLVGYLIVAVVVYGVVYYLFLGGKSYFSKTNQYQKQNAPQAADETSSASTSVESVEKVWQVGLDAQNGSGEEGTAYLYNENGKAKVVLDLSGEPSGLSQPAHVHVGACPNPGAVKFPLNNVLSGKSETVLPVSVSELKGMGALAINVHKSASEMKAYVACGDLN